MTETETVPLAEPEEAQEFMRQLRRDHPGKTDAELVAYVATMAEHYYNGTPPEPEETAT